MSEQKKIVSPLGWKRRIGKLMREKDRLASLVASGQRMSNFLYNLAQAGDVPEVWKRQAKMLVDTWDDQKVGKL